MIETLPLHHIARVVSLLTRGSIVAYPTGTSYGLGANALDRDALDRLNELKQRASGKAISLLLPEHDPERFVAWTPHEATVFRALRDRPLTLLVAARETTRHLAFDGRVGIRMPDHPFTRELAALLPFPITATSANRSSQTPACRPLDLEVLAESIRLFVVDGGTLPRRLPSTVAAFEDGRWTSVRHGDVTEVELADALTHARAPASIHNPRRSAIR